MILEQLNIIQYLTDGRKLFFPENFSQLELAFLVIPILFLFFFPKRILHFFPRLHLKAYISLSIVLICLLIQGAAWSNYGAHLGLWIFDIKNMSVVPGLVPFETYIFLICNMFLTSIITIQVRAFKKDSLKTFIVPKKNDIFPMMLMYFILTVYILMSILGWQLIHLGREEYILSGIILGFFGPIFIIEWVICHASFMKYPVMWLMSWILPGLYMFLVDSLAVNQGMWVYDYKFTTNIWIFDTINLEILLLYLAVSKVFAQPVFWAVDYYKNK